MKLFGMNPEDSLPSGLGYNAFRTAYSRAATSADKGREAVSKAWGKYKSRLCKPLVVYNIDTLQGLPPEIVKCIANYGRSVHGLLRRTCSRLYTILKTVNVWDTVVSLDEIVAYLKWKLTKMFDEKCQYLRVFRVCILHDCRVEYHSFTLVRPYDRPANIIEVGHSYYVANLFMAETHVRSKHDLKVFDVLNPLGCMYYVMRMLRYTHGTLLIHPQDLRRILERRYHPSKAYRDAYIRRLGTSLIRGAVGSMPSDVVSSEDEAIPAIETAMDDSVQNTIQLLGISMGLGLLSTGIIASAFPGGVDVWDRSVLEQLRPIILDSLKQWLRLKIAWSNPDLTDQEYRQIDLRCRKLHDQLRMRFMSKFVVSKAIAIMNDGEAEGENE